MADIIVGLEVHGKIMYDLLDCRSCGCIVMMSYRNKVIVELAEGHL